MSRSRAPLSPARVFLKSSCFSSSLSVPRADVSTLHISTLLNATSPSSKNVAYRSAGVIYTYFIKQHLFSPFVFVLQLLLPKKVRNTRKRMKRTRNKRPRELSLGGAVLLNCFYLYNLKSRIRRNRRSVGIALENQSAGGCRRAVYLE